MEPTMMNTVVNSQLDRNIRRSIIILSDEKHGAKRLNSVQKALCFNLVDIRLGNTLQISCKSLNTL